MYQENNKLKSRIEYLERKIERERNATNKQYEKWEKEAETKIKELSDENEQLKQELFEAEKDYLIETYFDNPIRRDDKIESLKKEFKERFGRDFE